MTNDEPAARCTLAMKAYGDLATCRGEWEQYSLEVATSFDGKTVGRIVVPSRDPLEILAAMGDYAREWSAGADSFTVFAFGSRQDAAEGPFNRGRIFWNDGGPIDVEVCSTFLTIDAADGSFEACDETHHMTLENS